MQAGRAAWLERMMALKRAGLIEKLPMGRKKGIPAKPANIVAKALVTVEQAENDLAAGRDGLARQFEEVVGLSLGKIRDALVHVPRGKPPAKFAQLMSQAQLGTQVLRVAQRSNEEMMRRRGDDRFLGLLERFARSQTAVEGSDVTPEVLPPSEDPAGKR